MQKAPAAKRAAMSPEEREAARQAIREKIRARNKFSGRKPTGANKQFAKSGGIRPSRAKDPSIGEIKQLFLHGTLDAVKEVRKIMMSSRSEALRLAAPGLGLEDHERVRLDSSTDIHWMPALLRLSLPRLGLVFPPAENAKPFLGRLAGLFLAQLFVARPVGYHCAANLFAYR